LKTFYFHIQVGFGIFSNFSSALHSACIRKNKEIVQLLLDHKDINAHQPNKSGETALHLAFKNSTEEIVQIFKDKFKENPEIFSHSFSQAFAFMNNPLYIKSTYEICQFVIMSFRFNQSDPLVND
jgi:ankyrin repeat protein